jgi:hypothetical protein
VKLKWIGHLQVGKQENARTAAKQWPQKKPCTYNSVPTLTMCNKPQEVACALTRQLAVRSRQHSISTSHALWTLAGTIGAGPGSCASRYPVFHSMHTSVLTRAGAISRCHRCRTARLHQANW